MGRIEATLLAVLLPAAGSGCERVQAAERVGVTAPPQAAMRFAGLFAKKVYFGHMSVGFNIVEGLRELAEAEAPGRMRIVESDDPAGFTGPVFAHGRNGRNGDPAAKIADFLATMDGGVGARADVAFFKFCFADVTAATDVDALFSSYRRAMEDLRPRYPGLVVVHVTVPLTTVQRGWKAIVKQALGRPPDSYLDNLRRGEYNALLRAAYAGNEPVYDLAAAESTSASGSVEEHVFAGRRFRSLVPAYTGDGGHLNALGRRQAALSLLGVLGAL